MNPCTERWTIQPRGIHVPRSLRVQASRFTCVRQERFLKEAREKWILSRSSCWTAENPASLSTTSRLQERECFYLLKTMFGYFRVWNVSTHISQPSAGGLPVTSETGSSVCRIAAQKEILPEGRSTPKREYPFNLSCTCPNIFICCGQLNGSHGEWTESDDMEQGGLGGYELAKKQGGAFNVKLNGVKMTSVDIANKLRTSKEAKNHTHAKKKDVARDHSFAGKRVASRPNSPSGSIGGDVVSPENPMWGAKGEKSGKYVAPSLSDMIDSALRALSDSSGVSNTSVPVGNPVDSQVVVPRDTSLARVAGPPVVVPGVIHPVVQVGPTVLTTYYCGNGLLGNTQDGPVVTSLTDDLYTWPSPKLRVKAFGCGWYQLSSVVDDNTKMCTPSLCVETARLESYAYRDVNGVMITYQSRYYQVFVPLLAAVRSKCRGSQVDSHYCNGVYSVLSTYTANCPPSISNHWLLRETCEYLIDSKHQMIAQQLQNTGLIGKMMNNGALIGSGDYGRERAALGISMRHGLVTRGQMWFTNPVPTALARDWVIRPDVEMVYTGQCRRVDDLDAGTNYLTFGNDLFPATAKHRTHFVQFCGFNVFEDGEFTARSMDDSVKRLIGCRMNENVYRQQALDFGAWMNPIVKKRGKQAVDGHRRLAGGRDGDDMRYRRSVHARSHPHHLRFIKEAIETFLDLTVPGFFEAKVDFVKNCAKDSYYGIWKLWNEHNPWENRREHSDLPNIKRKLRVTIHKGKPYDDEVGLVAFCRMICTKMKLELGKPGKSIRLVADMGDMCIYASSLPAYLKMATHGVHEFVLGNRSLRVFIYCKPEGKDLEYIGKEMAFAHRTEGCVFVAMSSDDSSYSGRINGVSFMANVDVSSNDSSQEQAAFSIVHMQQLAVDPNLAWGLLEGNLLPFKVTSPTDPNSTCTIRFQGPMEPSGHPNTTVDNNAGSFLIAIHAFCEICYEADRGVDNGDDPLSETLIEECIIGGAFQVGHLVTYERCSNMAEVQFLKRSFMWSEKRGYYIPVMNVAAYMRSLGSIQDDLVADHLGMEPSIFARTLPEERMNLFVGGVVGGWRHEAGNSILGALRKRFPTRVAEVVVEKFKHYTVSEITDIMDYSDEFDDGWLMARYDLDASELLEIVRAIDNCQLGDEFHLVGMAKIFKKDYGLTYV